MPHMLRHEPIASSSQCRGICRSLLVVASHLHPTRSPYEMTLFTKTSINIPTMIDRDHARSDEAGRLARRLQREMVSLWVFLVEHGVEAANNRAERMLRFGVLWRKGSHGTASDKG